MATTFFPTLQSMLVLLTFILTGLFLGKKRIVPDDAYRTLSKVCTTLFTPALSLSALLTSCTRESLKEQFWAIAAGTVVLAAAVALAVGKMVRNKKKGRTACGCDCGSCTCGCGRGNKK